MSWGLVVTAVVGAVSTAVSVSSAKKNAKRQKAALDRQNALASDSNDLQQEQLQYFREAIEAFNEQAFALADESKGEIKRTYRKSIDIIDKIPDVKELLGEGKELSREDFEYRTGIKRENLDFILGETQDELRQSQQINASLAGLDDSEFTGRFSKIIRSNLAETRANTLSSPFGTFANLSAQNLYNFSNQGLSNFLSINDFFSREGTVDPISPLTTAFDLRQTAEREAAMRIDNERYRSSSIADINASLTGALGSSLEATGDYTKQSIAVEQGFLENLINLSNARLQVDANKDAQINKAVADYASLLSQSMSAYSNASAQRDQASLNNSMIQSYTSGSSRYYSPTPTERTVSQRPAGFPQAS